jgi:hypothetical protein
MRIDPVYLLSPRPMHTRRAFLFAVGGAFAGGVVVGGLGGFAIGNGRAAAAPLPDAAPPLPGNQELEELRRLAVQAPIEELAGNWREFLERRDTAYAEDAVLLVGLVRLAEYLVSNPSAPNRRRVVQFLKPSIGTGRARSHARLQELLAELEKIR